MLAPRKVPEWDIYFLQMADVVSRRSKDPSTQHGAVLVDEHRRVISTGYNGGCRKIDDNLIDWSRPSKYSYVLHAEENSLWTADRKDLDGCSIYVTGPPCSRCMLRIAHSGITRVVYGPRSSQCVDEKDWQISMSIANLASVILEGIEGGDFSHFCPHSNGRT
jgi:dCMP deaminase